MVRLVSVRLVSVRMVMNRTMKGHRRKSILRRVLLEDLRMILERLLLNVGRVRVRSSVISRALRVAIAMLTCLAGMECGRMTVAAMTTVWGRVGLWWVVMGWRWRWHLVICKVCVSVVSFCDIVLPMKFLIRFETRAQLSKEKQAAQEKM